MLDNVIFMSLINFCKFHGFGNDYIVIEGDELKTVENLGEFTKKICHRNTGVGGDGIAVLEKIENQTADYSCRIINPDGSEAGFSGNGTRCAVAYLYYKNLWSAENLKLETKSGIKNYQFLKRTENAFWFRAELGKPNFDLPNDSNLQANETKKQNGKDLLNLILAREGWIFSCVFVDVGNPVVCIFLNDFSPFVFDGGEFEWQKIGHMIEHAEEAFPNRTNVVFIKVLDRENVEIRIWERGAGETASSGTCSIAAAVASAFTGKTERKVAVRAPGGITEAVWREDDEMLITGRADLVFCGEYFLE